MVVGILGTAIDVGVLALLVHLSGIDPQKDGVFYLFVSVAFILAVVNNFLLNQWWTFQVHGKGQKRRFIKFLLVALGGLCLSNVLMFLFIRIFDSVFVYSGVVIGTVMLVVLAKVCTSLLVLIWNFLVNKYWTFRVRFLEKKQWELPSHFPYEYSLVIPAYNEAKRLPSTFSAMEKFLGNFPHKVEVVVVDDGSSDNTASFVEEYAASHPHMHMRLVRSLKNFGKGHAVRIGMMNATGKYIVFTDADNSTPIEELGGVSKKVEYADIIIGSRYIFGSKLAIKQPWYRILLGRMANLLIQITLIDDIKDTQCGFKLFSHRAAKDIFSRMHIDGFGFDMECLALATTLQYRILEVPVSWYNSSDSRVRPVKDAIRTLKDLLAIKLSLWGGRYRVGGTAGEMKE